MSERLAASAYVVERTADGFVVRADLTDQHVFEPRRERAVQTLVQHHAVLDERLRVMTVTDEQVDVTWRAGAVPGSREPVLGAAVQVERRGGRVREVSFRRTWDPSEPPGERVVDEQRFDSHEALRHVREVATDLGWEERVGTVQRTATIVAVAGAAGAVLSVVILAVALLVR